MAVIPPSESNQTITIMSPQTLFYGLFFGLGGGMLLFIILSTILYWQHGRSGRIRLGVGGPGDLDDEQRLLEEEAAMMEQLDQSQQEAYYRAKGSHFNRNSDSCSRFSRTISSRKCIDGYFLIAVPFDSREGCVSMGIYSYGFRTVVECVCTIEDRDFIL